MKTLLTILAACLVTNQASALNLDVSRRDQKLATQQMVEKQTILIPIAASAGVARLLSANAGDVGSGPVTVISFLAQPDVPRVIVVTPGGTTADVAAGFVHIAGLDFFGEELHEDIAVDNDQSSASVGTLAFASVSSVTLPLEDGGRAASWSIGVGDKLGMKRCMSAAGHVLFATLAGVYETTRPTVVAGSSVANNTADLNGAYDGAKDVELFFVQNFSCLP